MSGDQFGVCGAVHYVDECDAEMCVGIVGDHREGCEVVE